MLGDFGHEITRIKGADQDSHDEAQEPAENRQCGYGRHQYHPYCFFPCFSHDQERAKAK